MDLPAQDTAGPEVAPAPPVELDAAPAAKGGRVDPLVAITIAAQRGKTERGEQLVRAEEQKKLAQRNKLFISIATGIVGLISLFLVIRLLKYECANDSSLICSVVDLINSVGDFISEVTRNMTFIIGSAIAISYTRMVAEGAKEVAAIFT